MQPPPTPTSPIYFGRYNLGEYYNSPSPMTATLQGSKSVKILIYMPRCICSALESQTLSNFACSKSTFTGQYESTIFDW